MSHTRIEMEAIQAQIDSARHLARIAAALEVLASCVIREQSWDQEAQVMTYGVSEFNINSA